FQMQIGERGENLSGGQRQGVAIARAVIADPPILLLDEPTSSMDTSTEAIFKSRLKQFARNKTMLVVTHRSSLLELAERVLVMDSGRIVADGPKEKVLEALRKGQIRRADA
ncbi:MAG: ATP-binding cassette domain-containing protein, partial [Chlorobium phaeobacteroides]|nr:ATP-binding cassette domain-containing protein [Chlorobium phaeobacteroides]